MRNKILSKVHSKKKTLFFATRHWSFDKRNAMILQNLPKEKSWVLDIGANTGETTNYLADNAHVAIGLEKMEPEYRVALNASKKTAGFLCTDVSADFILNGVRWDAILLLSVLHRIYAFEGEDQMKSVLSACGHKTNHLFIEGATRHARYMDNGEVSPGFDDLNVDAADQWHRKLFDEVLGDGWTVVSETTLECSDAEPFRLFYQLRRD